MTYAIWTVLGIYGLFELRTGGWLVRTAYKEFVRGLILFDLACLRAVQKVIRPQYVIRGACHRRGTCCKGIIGDPPRLVKKTPWLLAAYVRYHTVMHRFAPVARGPHEEVIFACGHLRSDGRCGIYRYRPRICRNYPVVPFFGTPQVLPGCGYGVAPRVVAQMRQRPGLPIVNATPAVHHPTPLPHAPHELERASDYHRVDVCGRG